MKGEVKGGEGWKLGGLWIVGDKLRRLHHLAKVRECRGAESGGKVSESKGKLRLG